MASTREHRPLIWQDDDRVSGAVCFYGTRVPVQHMLDYVHAGQTIQEFSADYRIPLDQAQGVLELTLKGFETLLAKAVQTARILLDENVPIALVPLLEGHNVDHVDPLGMKSVRNGELLAFARLHYDLFVTLDRGILHQHDHRPYALRILVIRVYDSRKETVLARIHGIRRTIETMPELFRGEIQLSVVDD